MGMCVCMNVRVRVCVCMNVLMACVCERERYLDVECVDEVTVIHQEMDGKSVFRQSG